MTPTMADERLMCADVLAAALEEDGVSAALSTASRPLGPAQATAVGLWAAGPGHDQDVEVDEVFLVLLGRGTLSFEDGSSIVLEPGVLVRLRGGDRTTWTVTERLRKLYLA